MEQSRFFRRSELVLIAYFVYTGVLAQVLPVRTPIALITFSLNLTIITGFVLLAYADSLRRGEFLSIVRDWYPAPLMLLAYREMGWFAPADHNHALERMWVGWDKFLLNELGLKAAIESLGPILPSILEIAYSLVYATWAIGMVMLYVWHRRERVDSFLFTFLLGILISYALFPYFPSEPPRTAFPGQDFPAYQTIFRKFNWSLLGGYGIHTSVFPSAHVSGAFSAAFGVRLFLPEHKKAGILMLILAVLIATSTVYGRYHYSADAVAGFVVALIARGIAGRSLAAGTERASR